MVGSTIYHKLKKEGYNNLLIKISAEPNLRNQQAVADFFFKEKIDYVFLTAAKVGHYGQ